MLTLFAATVVTTLLQGGTVPPSCQDRLSYASHTLTSLERDFFAAHGDTRKLVVYVVTPTSVPVEERDSLMAWTYPDYDSASIWLRVDVLCVASKAAILTLLAHEALHLDEPSFTHAQIDAVLASDPNGVYAAYLKERDGVLFYRTAAWQRAFRDWLGRATPYLGPEPIEELSDDRRTRRVRNQTGMAGSTP